MATWISNSIGMRTFEEKGTQSRQEWIDQIDETVKASIEAHTISDVEVGSFLSKLGSIQVM